MRAATLIAPCIALCLASPVQGQNPTLSYTLHHVGEQGHTYRIHAEFANEGDHLTALYASSSEPAEATSANGFYQDPLGGPTSADINPILIGFYPDLAYDSWFTIGAEDSEDNALNSAGSTDWQSGNSTWESGASWAQAGPFGGSFYILPTDPQGAAGPDLKVLVAQWTVKGAVNSVWNLQWRAEGEATSEEVGQLTLDIPAPEGCTDPTAVNYLDYAGTDDGSCVYPEPTYAGLTYEDVTSEVGTPDGVGRTWRIYAQFDDENDELTSIFGTADHPMTLSSTNGFHQTPGGSALPEFAAADLASTPALGWDSWVTIGAENEPTEVNTLGLDLSTFEAGGDLGHDATFGGSWYVFPGESELAHPDAEGRVLIAQLTTTGIITAELNLQYRDQNNQAILVYNESLSFPSPNAGCMDPTACNFDAEATEEDGSCVAPTCDDPNACNYDADGLCGGGECIPAGCFEPDACNYNPLSTCGGIACIPSGCTDPVACNFNPLAECDGEACEYVCCPGPACCGEGTHWDPVLETCLPDTPEVPDAACSVFGLQDLASAHAGALSQISAQNDLIESLQNQLADCNPGSGPCASLDHVTYGGHDYALTAIGDQCWFAENLRSTDYTNGDAIPAAANWGSTTDGAQAVYDGDEINAFTYGRLYNWHAVEDARGLCPSGWHVPDDTEWQALIDAIGAQGALQLKATSGWTVGPNGTDDHGFDGRPAGYRSTNGVYANLGALATWWSATPNDNGGDAHVYSLIDNSDEVYSQQGISRQQGRSIRCLKN